MSMLSTINVGDTIRLKAVFRLWSIEDETYGPPVDPADNDVTVDIFKKNLDGDYIVMVGAGGNATRNPSDILEPVEHYFFDWEPTEKGEYKFAFTGIVNGQPTIIEDYLEVGSTNSFASSLMEEQELIFMGELEPLYIDPEALSLYYSEASLTEVAETVHRFSVEVVKILGDPEELPYVAYEYIEAATLCWLSKKYDYGIGGGDATSLSLGDLSISNQSYPKKQLNRGNSSSWCELASALREEILRSGAGMRAIVAGSRYSSKMPGRRMKRADQKTYLDYRRHEDRL